MAIDIVYIKEIGSWFVRNVFHPFITIASPAVVLALTAYLVIRAFRWGISNGVRSVAAVLLPSILVTFVYMFDRELFMVAEELPAPLSFLGALLVGMAALAVVRFVAELTSFPLAELLLSLCFSVLVYGCIGLHESRILSYCYGIFSGFLLYVVVLGFPTLGGRKDEAGQEG